MRVTNVLRPNAGGQTIHRVVCLGQDFARIVERCRRDDGAEDLFTHDLHARLHVDDHGRRDEISALASAPATARQRPRALVDSGLNVSGHAVELLVRDQGADIRGLIETGSDLHPFGRRCNTLRHLVEHRAFDKQA